MRKTFVALVLLVGASGLAPAQTNAPAGDPVSGKALFMADGCYQCHGTVGQGSRGTGPRLAPNPVPYEGFAQQVRKPANVMPPYTPLVLSDAQLADIYAYVSSLPGSAKSDDVKDPALRDWKQAAKQVHAAGSRAGPRALCCLPLKHAPAFRGRWSLHVRRATSLCQGQDGTARQSIHLQKSYDKFILMT